MSKVTSEGFSAERLGRIDRFLAQRYVAPGKLAGLHLVVTRRGKTVHQTLLGHSDLERGVMLGEDAVYRIYSMTKPVTSVAFMMLVEEGLVALDDPVAKYIPAWAGLGVQSAGVYPLFQTTPVARPMLVVDLLRHTSGLTYGFQARSNVDAAYRRLGVENMFGEHDLEGMIQVLAKLPLEFSPGEAWNYSVSTDVVGYLVQKLCGKPLGEVLQQRIFGPLKMVDTGFSVREDQRSRFTACYEVGAQGRLSLQDDPRTSPFLRPPTMESGGGGLVSTTADYLRFTQMLLNGGELDGVRILAPKTVKLMAANHLGPDAYGHERDLTQMSRSMFSESTNAGVGFGLGFATIMDAAKTLVPCSTGEFYWGGMASTAFWVDPVEEITMVLMTQLMPSSSYPIRRELRTLIYSALMETQA